jgi:hypothetical protein
VKSSSTWLGEACRSLAMAGRIGSTRPRPMNETTAHLDEALQRRRRRHQRGDLFVGHRGQMAAQRGAVVRAHLLEHRRALVGQRDENRAPVGRVALARDPVALEQALDHQRDRRLRQPLAAGQLGDPPRSAVEGGQQARLRARDAPLGAPQQQSGGQRRARQERRGDLVRTDVRPLRAAARRQSCQAPPRRTGTSSSAVVTPVTATSSPPIMKSTWIDEWFRRGWSSSPAVKR